MNLASLSDTRPRRARGRPKRDAVADIENVLVSVALQEFLANGYGATSMSRIALRAHVSKTTLYTRYASKEILFRDILHRQLAKLFAIDDLKQMLQGLGLREGLKTFVRATLIPILSGELLELNRLILSETRSFPELGAAAHDRTVTGIAHLAEFIQHCAQEENMPCKDAETAAAAFIYLHRGWYLNIIMAGVHIPTPDVQDWIDRSIDVFLAGQEHW